MRKILITLAALLTSTLCAIVFAGIIRSIGGTLTAPSALAFCVVLTVWYACIELVRQ